MFGTVNPWRDAAMASLFVFAACAPEPEPEATPSTDGSTPATDGGSNVTQAEPTAPQTTESQPTTSATTDAGSSSASISTGSESESGGSTGASVDCDTQPPVDLTLTPDSLVVVDTTVRAACEPLDHVYVLRNASDATQHVERISFSFPQVSVSQDGLPVDVAPGDAMEVRLSLDATEPLEEEAVLTVQTAEGCAEFPATVLVIEDPIGTLEPLALDFGNVPAGTTSAVETVRILDVGQSGSATVAGFATDNSAFRIESAPEGAPMLSCEELTVELVFDAPARTGPQAGYLYYEVHYEDFAGVIGVPLSARSTP